MGRVNDLAHEVSNLANVPFEVQSLKELVELIDNDGDNRAFNFVNVHSLIESTENNQHLSALKRSAINLPDGFPIAFMLCRKYGKFQKISGPDVLQYFIDNSDLIKDRNLLLIGGTKNVLDQLGSRFKSKGVSTRCVDPGVVEIDNLDEVVDNYCVEFTWADLCFVGLGCPKQELLCQKIVERHSCHAFGFGAAFDFVTGTKKRAPKALQRIGLEWLHRLLSEPKRLLGRYVRTNTKYLCLILIGKL